MKRKPTGGCVPDDHVRVAFQPYGREAVTLAGSSLLETAACVGLTIETPCGGGGRCGKCRVQITAGAPPPGAVDTEVLSPRELSEGWRLACQTHLKAPATVYVPESSLFGSRHQILIAMETPEIGELRPAVRKEYVTLEAPTIESDEPDLLRLEARLGHVKTDASMLRELPGKLRNAGFKGTAVLTDHHLIDFEPGDTTGLRYGVAFDVGTTTLVGVLVNLTTGREAAVASRMNPQVRYGDDVLSRIRRVMERPGGLTDLRDAVAAEIASMVSELCEHADVTADHIYEATFSGNTTMEHLLCGLDPSALGQVPFTSVFARGLLLSAADLGIPIHPRGLVYVFPIIGGFVGGDTVAGMLAARIDAQDGPTLMVDIGTNGEIVLAHDSQLWAASTAAGPAFEGARISCGMRATAGAIEKIVIDGDVRCSVIGDAPPVGLCGSALIDAVAEMLRHGIVSPQGRLRDAAELPPNTSEPLRRRLCRDRQGEPAFLLAEGATPVTLTQRDIRELQLASGAIRAGINILLKNARLHACDLARIRVAGAFGSFIRRSNAQRIGLLPSEVDRDRIQHVGNASLSGARWALLSTGARARAEELARRTRHVDLSRDPDFDLEFAMAMIFPDEQA